MRNKKRYIVGCLSIVLLLIAVLGCLYAFLAFSPTGYKEFEQAHADEVSRVRESLKATPRPGTSDAATTFSETTTEPPADFVTSLNRLGGMVLISKDPAAIQELSFVRDMAWNGIGYFTRRASGSGSAKIADGVIKSYDSWHARDPWANFQFKHLNETRRSIGLSLDDIEKFLANVPYGSFPEFNDFLSVSHSIQYRPHAVLAVIRACERREWEKATALLENYFDMQQRIALASFSQDVQVFDYARTIYFLAAYPEFPADKLARIQAKLDGMILTPDQIESLRKAHALRAAYLYKKNRDAMMPGMITNSWHYFTGGRLESVTRDALAPILDRQMEELVMAWVKGDEGEIKRREDRVESTRRLMNINYSPLKFYYVPSNGLQDANQAQFSSPKVTDEDRCRVRGDFANSSVELNRVILAVVRYHNAAGHWPDSMSELVPKYLSSTATKPIWNIMRIPLPRREDKPTSETETFAITTTIVGKSMLEVRSPAGPPIAPPLRELLR